MASPEDAFLRLTFDGGRFIGHAAPVSVLAELSTFQNLISTVARLLLLADSPERTNVPRGFAEEAQLFLRSTEDNCFTAGLIRPHGSIDHEKYFAAARDLSIAALEASTHDVPVLPDGFPREGYILLAGIGRKLHDDESLLVRNGTGPQARVTKQSRERLATLVRVPLELDEVMDGEVEQIDDASRVFILRRKGERLEVPYKGGDQRSLVADALQERPLVGIRFQGLIVAGPGARKAKRVEELESFEHPRAAEVRTVWARLDHLSKLQDGWLEGDGVAPSEDAVVRAHDVLARLLVDVDWIDRPRVYPTPDGGIQAEWTIGPWVCEVVFSPNGSVRGEATQTEDDQESEIDLSGVTAGNADQLAKWLGELTTEDGKPDRV